MKVEFDITLTQKDMYRFGMYHAYKGLHGFVSVLLGILVLIVSLKTYGHVELMYTVLYALFGLLFLFFTPVSLYGKTKRQLMTSEVLKNTLHYSLTENGIQTSQKDASAQLPWEQVYLMVATKHNLLIYSNRVNAYVIPRDQIENQYEAIKKLAQQHLEKYRIKMK